MTTHPETLFDWTAARPATSLEYAEGWGMAAGSVSRILRPRSLEELAQCYALARREGVTLGLRGTGNSYGDASLNGRGYVLDTSRMNRILAWDPATGVATCEPGVTIEKLWKSILADGWWPRVVSGTMFPTLGGAAAMNIHGKNNYAVGTIGDAIREFDLATPAGEHLTCSRERNADLFHAAIGGFGMLGAFTRIVLETKKVHSGDLRVRAKATRDLAAMIEYIEAHKADADYLVGWVDCFARGRSLGRGLIHHANYLHQGEDPDPRATLTVEHQELPANILGVFPKDQVWRALRLFNHDLGMRAINFAKYRAGFLEELDEPYLQSHAGFAFLLDYVPNWKWAYGRTPRERGLIQYQSFVPHAAALATFTELLERCHAAGLVPYLGVFKRHRPDPFWLTHAVDGWSFALDFKVEPSTRERLWRLCHELSETVIASGGRFYFAKDLVLRPEDAARAFPADRLAAFRALKARHDPDGTLATDLWRRVFAPAQG
ncbi:MAG: FAD-binding oxidoreductase [Planctomycetes bacterium]|nr:FAD-binding oxidoreductase [Planctomycetota bacterium]